jgi:redox-sensing transcriptional repressor
VSTPPEAGSEGSPGKRAIPEASVARLAVYLRMLGELAEQGAETVSSEELAAATGVNPAKLRKDLSYIGSYGIRGVGYDVTSLSRQLDESLGLNHPQAVALVGIGNLGHALAGYGGFGGRGFPVTALFDVDPDLVGIHINGILVEHVHAIPEICAERDVTIGIVATPGAAAQGVCDLLVSAGVRSILNFAPVVLQVPEEVEVRKVDLAVELQILAFHVARRHPDGGTAPTEEAALNGHAVNGSAVNGSAVNGSGVRSAKGALS